MRSIFVPDKSGTTPLDYPFFSITPGCKFQDRERETCGSVLLSLHPQQKWHSQQLSTVSAAPEQYSFTWSKDGGRDICLTYSTFYGHLWETDSFNAPGDEPSASSGHHVLGTSVAFQWRQANIGFTSVRTRGARKSWHSQHTKPLWGKLLKAIVIV